MNQTNTSGDDLNAEVRRAWDENAPWWDERVGEGNRYQRVLIGPATERLLALEAGETVLDVACGNGNFSRRLAQLGARVVAFDFSEAMVARARERTPGAGIEYHVIDATDEAQLHALGEHQFDAAVCTMALMDMADIAPPIRSLGRLLTPEGRFVFSVLHPCFNSAEETKMVAERDYDGRGSDTHALKISKYITPSAWQGEAIAGQPSLQYYFHRPLSVLFGACFDAGFVLDGLEEPTFDDAAQPTNLLSWENLRDVPPVLVARMRRDPRSPTLERRPRMPP